MLTTGRVSTPPRVGLRAGRDLWDTVLRDKMGGLDLHEPEKLQLWWSAGPESGESSPEMRRRTAT